MNVSKELKDYIENNIFPEYEKNDKGHNLQHIDYVINRSIKFANTIPDINYNIVYTVAAYHDIRHHIDPKKHELISAEIMYADDKLKEFFNDEQIFEDCHYHLNDKFGENGYAKFYFKDEEYEKFLTDIRDILANKDRFIEIQRRYINELKNNGVI